MKKRLSDASEEQKTENKRSSAAGEDSKTKKECSSSMEEDKKCKKNVRLPWTMKDILTKNIFFHGRNKKM